MQATPAFLDTRTEDEAHWAENERQMATNRMVITTILFFAVAIFGRDHESMGSGFTASAYLAFLGLAATFFLHVRIWPRARAWRRVAILVTDIVALSFVAYHAGPAYVGLLYPGYLLVIYGFGFRYGVKWLAASGIMSIVGVSGVMWTSPLWQGNDLLSGGLIVGLIIIPAYALNLVRNLWAAKAKAEESARAKSMFVAAVSHDLRTPLNAIIGLGDILAASKLPREEADMARMIGQAGRSLLGQINSILDFSRLEMSNTPAPRERVDLFDMLHSIRELLDVSAQAKGVRLLLRVDMPTPRWIETNARHIRDSLVNLVGNAIKFTPEGHVEIFVTATRMSGGEARLRFEVRDSGIGMGADEQARIFDRFTQANDGIREIYGGSGLGLAIARQLVAGLGGEIGVSSARGLGSVFWFEIDAAVAREDGTAAQVAQDVVCLGGASDVLALARAAGLAPRTASEIEPQDSGSSGKPQEVVIVDLRATAPTSARMNEALAVGRRGAIFIVDDPAQIDIQTRGAGCSVLMRWPFNPGDLANAMRVVSGAPEVEAPRIEQVRAPARDLAILVAEDNKTNQKVIGKMLSLVGRKATIVDDGHAALDILALERFDVVLMDINMPRIDGIEATRRLRAFERSLGRRTPVIALTADVTDETRARCLAAGIDDCVTKPIDLPTLVAAIDRLLHIDLAAPGEIEHGAEPQAASGLEPDHAREEPAAVADGDINAAALADLERLGGTDFVREVATQFVADAALILKELAAAARENDVEKFRDEAHALRSCSANVGARSIYKLCLSWREISPEEFASEGLAYVQRLEQEYEKARTGLAPYTAEAA